MFISVPEERLATDVMKTWLTYFSADSAFSGVAFSPRHPDKDTPFAMPLVVLTRVSEERQKLERMNGYFGTVPSDDQHAVGILQGPTLLATFQFDVLASSIGDANRLRALMDMRLKTARRGEDGLPVDEFATIGPQAWTVIPLYDFSSPESGTGTVTDLAIRFKFWKDVHWTEVPTFSPQLHQLSCSVQFWVHYQKQNDVPKVETVVTDFSS